MSTFKGNGIGTLDVDITSRKAVIRHSRIGLEIEEKTMWRGRENADRLESEIQQADITNEEYYHEDTNRFLPGSWKRKHYHEWRCSTHFTPF
jgi:hypothetical protein